MGRSKSPPENVVITSQKEKTQVRTYENGELLINVSTKDVRKFKANGLVRFGDFGASGDGKTDDLDAIAAAHAFANQYGLSVKADEGATCYIGGKNRTAVIRADNDFGTTAFIIDDTALPIDGTTLTITGGRFTTIANIAESKYTYYSRGIAIRRSNILVNGLELRVTGERDHGVPYGGFINIGDCSCVTVRNTILTGRNMDQTVGSAGVTVSMGTYDISLNRAFNVSFLNCTQTNDINDSRYWRILGSNYCKNLVYDKCIFSRFDAHMGVANATIRNCVFVPAGGRTTSASLIGGSNSGQHDFDYTCYMPERITITNPSYRRLQTSGKLPGARHFCKFQSTDDKRFLPGEVSLCQNQGSHSPERDHRQWQNLEDQRQPVHVQGCEGKIRLKSWPVYSERLVILKNYINATTTS